MQSFRQIKAWLTGIWQRSRVVPLALGIFIGAWLFYASLFALVYVTEQVLR